MYEKQQIVKIKHKIMIKIKINWILSFEFSNSKNLLLLLITDLV